MKIDGQGSFSNPVHCVQCGEYFVVSDHDEHCIKVFNRKGYCQYKLGNKGKGDGEFNYPGYLLGNESVIVRIREFKSLKLTENSSGSLEQRAAS